MPQLKMTCPSCKQPVYVNTGTPVITLGRCKKHHVCFSDKNVSRNQGLIFMSCGQFFFTDTSKNGTSVEITGKHPIDVQKNADIELEGKGAVIPKGQKGRAEFSVEFTSNELQTKEAGILLLKNKKYPDTCQFFEQKIKADPHDTDSYYYSGVAASNLNLHDNAIVRLRQYLEKRPSDIRAMRELGMVYENNDQAGKAARLYQKVAALEKGISRKNHIPAEEIQRAKHRIRELERYSGIIDHHAPDNATIPIASGDRPDIKNTFFFSVSYLPRIHQKLFEQNNIGDLLDQAYQDIGCLLDFFPAANINVALVHSGSNVSGTTNSQKIVLNLPASLKEKPALKVLVKHEYAHYCLIHYCLQRSVDHHAVPWWIHEGFAQNMSQKITPGRLYSINRRAEIGRLFSLQELETLTEKTKDSAARTAYLQAHAAVEWLITNQGIQSLKKIIKALKKSRGIDDAFNAAGLDYKVFENTVFERLKQQLEKDGHNLTTI